LIKTTIRLKLDKYPRLYLSLLRAKRRRHWSRAWVVSKNTEVVIEGFPRSANSFAREAFLTGQRRIRRATHVHSSAQVVQACRWKIPTLVLMRDPRGAVCGDVAFGCELAERDPQHVRAGEINDSLRRYIAFYERVEPFHEGFMVGHFPEVTKDFGAVMRKFNEYFGTEFVVFEHTEEAVQKITAMSFHVGPQANREAIKAVVHEKYENDAAAALKDRARSIYERLLQVKGIELSNGD
jgi:hypothetical protein